MNIETLHKANELNGLIIKLESELQSRKNVFNSITDLFETINIEIRGDIITLNQQEYIDLKDKLTLDLDNKILKLKKEFRELEESKKDTNFYYVHDIKADMWLTEFNSTHHEWGLKSERTYINKEQIEILRSRSDFEDFEFILDIV